MRLINTTTYELHDFIDGAVAPKYAILSHRWQEDEVLYKRYIKGRYSKDAQGYRKIIQCCDFARERGQQWVWIDTVCIQKNSSAELSEAINSMFHWYSKAEICYAYLSDVSAPADDCNKCITQFRASKWFTRGWTLQELIAPKHVIFVNSSWTVIGTKWSPDREDIIQLADIIEEVTGVPQEVLAVPESRYFYSVAQRMSWASTRITSRIEDAAYSLLGIFGVNMALLYGEGKDAFLRLQRELFSRTGDESMFAWPLPAIREIRGGTIQYDINGANGMLAEEVKNFAGMNNVRCLSTKDAYLTLTGYGAEMMVKKDGHPRVFFSNKDSRFVCLPLLSVADSRHERRNDDFGKAYRLYFHTTGCGHYGRFNLPEAVQHDHMDWKPFPHDHTLIVHHSKSETFRYCSSISFQGRYYEGQHYGHTA
ncbi:hypothetical protein LTR62_007855 [Meristemomyces frigidus]|uniref:Heterokaryon incompatibility domain-containing protein n=1 Tax=Meristemomyces frigidus TaxID=1508187 RepID=A0AAN7TIF6_9PEZI|nr:hypothetical protein LTR62_007855 [Meristemomyces frigidus]